MTITINPILNKYARSVRGLEFPERTFKPLVTKVKNGQDSLVDDEFNRVVNFIALDKAEKLFDGVSDEFIAKFFDTSLLGNSFSETFNGDLASLRKSRTELKRVMRNNQQDQLSLKQLYYNIGEPGVEDDINTLKTTVFDSDRLNSNLDKLKKSNPELDQGLLDKIKEIFTKTQAEHFKSFVSYLIKKEKKPLDPIIFGD